VSYNISDYLGSDEVLGSYLDANRAVDTARTMAKSSALIRIQRASTATFHETVRIEPLGGSSFANEVRGDVAKIGSVQVIVVGYKDHPDYADTNILRGDRFVIVSYGAHSGAPAELLLPDLSAQGLQWQVDYTAEGLTLTAVEPTSPASPPSGGGGSSAPSITAPPSQLIASPSAPTGAGTGASESTDPVAEAASFEPELEEVEYISAAIKDQSLDRIYDTESSLLGLGSHLPSTSHLTDELGFGESLFGQLGEQALPADKGLAGGAGGLTQALAGEAAHFSAEAAEIIKTLQQAAEYLQCGR